MSETLPEPATPAKLTTFEKLKAFVVEIETEALKLEHEAITDAESLFERIRKHL